MIRELKCRAWNGHKNEWYDPKLIKVSLDFSLIGLWCGPEHGYIFSDTASWDVTIQVYTGLKDKNGKDICEGDIVKGICLTHGDSIAVVGLDTAFGIFYTDIDYYPVTAFSHCFSMMQEHNEVIGNIFENPELLKK